MSYLLYCLANRAICVQNLSLNLLVYLHSSVDLKRLTSQHKSSVEIEKYVHILYEFIFYKYFIFLILYVEVSFLLSVKLTNNPIADLIFEN